MNHKLNSRTVKELLDVAATGLPKETLDSLRLTRTRALERQRVKCSVPVLAWIDFSGDNTEHRPYAKPMNWAVAMLLAACLISGATLWHNYKTEHEICEVDVAILTDDMPLHVYVD